MKNEKLGYFILYFILENEDEMRYEILSLSPDPLQYNITKKSIFHIHKTSE